MTDSIREQVLAAFFTAINGDAAFRSVDVERNRGIPVPAGKTQYVVVYDGGEPQAIASSGISTITMTPAVELYQRGATRAAATTALNNLAADAIKAALADYSLGGLSIDVRYGGMSDPIPSAEDNRYLMTAEIIFQIDYQTDDIDPYTAAP
jgi:hypothetical protein